MKRVALLLTVLAVAACSVNDITPGGPSRPVTREYTAFFTDDSTRTAIGPDGSVQWRRGDTLRYYSRDCGAVSQCGITSDGSTATVSVTTDAADTFIAAVYGASSLSSCTGQGCTLTGAVPSVQQGDFASSHLSAAICRNPDSPSLKFYNLVSLVKFSLARRDVAFVTFSAGDTKIHGDGTVAVDFSGETPTASFPSDAGGNQIKVSAGDSGTFYVTTLPCTLKGFTITLYGTSGKIIGQVVSTATQTLPGSSMLELGTIDGRITPPDALAEAKVGDDYFITLKDAVSNLNSASTPATLTLLQDADYGVSALSLTNKKSATTLDLNGKRLDAASMTINASDFTLTDSSTGGIITLSNAYAITVYSAKMTLRGGCINCLRAGVRIVNSNGRFAIEGGRFSSVEVPFQYTAKGKITISAGRIVYSSDDFYTTTVKGALPEITGGEFSSHPGYDLPKPYFARPVNDTTHRVEKASTIIGISHYGGTGSNFRECMDALGVYLYHFPTYATSDAMASSFMSEVDAFIIPGKSSGDTSVRSTCDLRLIKAAVAQGKPVLGICYGIQRINKYCGGDIPAVTDLAPDSPYRHKYSVGGVNVGVQEETHPINIVEGSTLSKVYGGATYMMVNTSHNYACGKIGDNLKVTATCPDGIVEAIESTDGSMLYGLQFHPEALFHYRHDANHLAFFRFLIDKAIELKGE